MGFNKKAQITITGLTKTQANAFMQLFRSGAMNQIINHQIGDIFSGSYLKQMPITTPPATSDDIDYKVSYENQN